MEYGTLSLVQRNLDSCTKREPLSAIPLDKAEDNELAAQAVAGNSRAFEALVRRYQKLVYNVIYQMVQSHETASDLTQETFLRTFRGMSSYRLDGKFKPWLLRIASNTTLNYIRDSKGRQADSLEGMLDENPLAEPASSESVEQSVELRFSQAMLADALKQLPERHRQVFVLRYQHDLPYAEIAAAVDEPETTIKSLLFRIREKLRKMLVEESRE